MDLYGDGHKYVTDEKVNVRNSLTRINTDNKFFSDVFGDFENDRYLVSFRDNSPQQALTVGGLGAGIGFGCVDTRGILSVEWNQPTALISGGSGSSNWTLQIAWKSDIQRLEQEISDLKKQIGGVIGTLLNYIYQGLHCFPGRKAVA